MEVSEGSIVAIANTPGEALGTYGLRELIKDVHLSSEGDDHPTHITCVDVWNGNLYIGTSAGEVLHYVSIPPDPSDSTGQPNYIFATKLEPQYVAKQEEADTGVKQILVLPDPTVVCILCNGTLTFYTLPELSPAFGGQIKQTSCTWVGGLDANRNGEESDSTVIVICLKQRLRLIKIGKDARKIRDIELSGVSAIQRTGDLACVAENNTYALLDVVNQRKNDLFPISSLTAPGSEKLFQASPQSQGRAPSRSISSSSSARQGRGHDRNTSLGARPKEPSHLQPDNSLNLPPRSSSRQNLSPAEPLSRESSPAKSDAASPRVSMESSDKPLPAAPTPEHAATRPLPPNIATPTATEFLLTTGTKLSDPGVGMFVNMDGDVSRGTIEFSSYPESLVLDGPVQTGIPESPGLSNDKSYVLALIRKQMPNGPERAIEIQRWDSDADEAHRSKEWLMVDSQLPSSANNFETNHFGLRTTSSKSEVVVAEISLHLSLRRLTLKAGLAKPNESDAKRNAEEDKFAGRFSQVQTSVLFFAHNKVSWVMKTPLIMRLEQQLSLTLQKNGNGELAIDVPRIQEVINSIRGQEPRDELEFLTLTYARQKSSLLLFGNLLLRTANGSVSSERDRRYTEEALVAGDIDPRTILSLVPSLADEIAEGDQGIWIAQGLRHTINMLHDSFNHADIVQDPAGAYGDNILRTIERYLFVWRMKKGFGSVADESHVFQTVDAALIHVLLLLDQSTPRGPAIPNSLRAKLNGVVDDGVDCFNRAVALFEQFNRLFMLSRLYQSRKMAAQVLATWKRILEGEYDAGGELTEGEHVLRRYLTRVSDQGLVQEYAAWLANRNPKLGVQVFADDTNKVKFQPAEAVAILKEKAPAAVKDYLEHLVFGKNHVQYVNDLIAFYLDTILDELKSSEGAKSMLQQSYETYRALRPPKPTYRQFITDQSIEAEWWKNRLRLLQLIGGSHGAASKYNVQSLRERLTPYSDELVPEMIILNGREGKHQEALRLLTHGLGDYDTAIRYCLLGGSSIFHPGSGLAPKRPLPSKEEQAQLFEYLLHNFFRIEDLSERLERTAELLERFGGWFDVAKVLDLIPDSWSVELVSGFLLHAMGRLLRERNETIVVKALSSAQNLRRNVEFIEKTENTGSVVVNTAVDAE